LSRSAWTLNINRVAETGSQRNSQAAQTFSTRAAARILAVSPGRIRYWIRHKLISPSSQDGKRYRFAFNDLLKLRMTKDLLQGGRRLKGFRRGFEGALQRVDSARPLTSLQLSSSGGRLLVRDRSIVFEADSGQMLLAFETEPPPAGKLEERFAAARAGARFEEAKRLAESDPMRAMMLYRDLIRQEPRNFELHLQMAGLLERDGDLAGAIRHLLGAAMLAPGNADVHLRLGLLYRQRKESELALQSFTRATECDPLAAEAHRNLADLYEQAGRKRDALRHLSQLHRLDRDS
jgi:tetratricopeptide (TPR) repeat protein